MPHKPSDQFIVKALGLALWILLCMVAVYLIVFFLIAYWVF